MTPDEKPIRKKYLQAVEQLINSDDSQKELAKKLGVSEMAISKYKNKAVKDGLIDNERHILMKGARFLSAHNLEIPAGLRKPSSVDKHKGGGK